MDIRAIQRLTQTQLAQEFKTDPTSVAALNALSNDWIVSHPDELKKTILAIDEANPQGWAEKAEPLLKRIRAAVLQTLKPERGSYPWIIYFFNLLINVIL